MFASCIFWPLLTWYCTTISHKMSARQFCTSESYIMQTDIELIINIIYDLINLWNKFFEISKCVFVSLFVCLFVCSHSPGRGEKVCSEPKSAKISSALLFFLMYLYSAMFMYFPWLLMQTLGVKSVHRESFIKQSAVVKQVYIPSWHNLLPSWL